MEPLDKTEQTALSLLLQNAITRFRVLNLNPRRDDLLDPSESYSIGEVLLQHVDFLDAVQYLTVDEPDPALLRRLSKLDSRQGQDNPYSYWHFSKLLIDVRSLEKQLEVLREVFNDLNEEFHGRRQLEIGRNRFVGKWEPARREQLVKAMEIRELEFRKETEVLERYVGSGMDAARKIDDHYSWQLAKVETDINDWMERFDREKDDIDSRLQKARAKKRQWDEMKGEVERRKEEVAQLEVRERTLSEEAEHRRMCEKFAVRIQAWWRGVMVRKGFGKGKKKKGKKGAKKGAKKGKAKKSKK